MTLRSSHLKYLMPALATALCGAASVAQEVSDLKADIDVLKKASYYAIGFTGAGGMQAPGQTALIHIHQSPDRDNLIRQANASGNLIAKLYVACWSSTFDKKLHSAIREEIVKSSANETVTTLIGSVMRQRKVDDILREMSSSECGKLAVAGEK